LNSEPHALPLEPLHQPFFLLDVFEIVSHELFAWAAFEPWSSWSLPPEKLELQVWSTSATLEHFQRNWGNTNTAQSKVEFARMYYNWWWQKYM
jgi:hypothetical protein